MTYYQGGGYEHAIYNTSKYEKLSLGNMGFKTDQCAFTPLTMGKLYMNCEYGHITKMTSFGINSFEIKNRDACNSSPELNNTMCTGIVNTTYINE